MKANQLLTSLAIVGGVALAMPAFAQQNQPNPGQNQAQDSSQMPAADSSQTTDQAQSQNGRQDIDQNQAQNQDQTQAPSNDRHLRRSHSADRGRNYGDGLRAGSLGMDVAPGGGTYTRRDVASEQSGRMSHPVVGERRAPSSVAQGSLAHVDEVESSMTAKLNQQQLNGQGEMTATLPNQNQEPNQDR
jgi:hypothetical protein